jgi:hypothetical protein
MGMLSNIYCCFSHMRSAVLIVSYYRSRVILETLPFLSQSRNSLHLIEPKGSLLHLQVPFTSPYPEPDQSTPCPPSHFLMIHLVILPSMPGSSKWSLYLFFPSKPFIHLSCPPYWLHALPISLFSN